MGRKKKSSLIRESTRVEAESPGLAALFGGSSSFTEKGWLDKPQVFHHDDFLAPEIWHLPDLQSLEGALTIAAPGTIFANLPDRNEEYNQIQLVNPEDVIKAHACKMGISMEPDMGKLTELLFWLRSIQRDLGLSQSTYSRCNIYAIPDGGRTGCHYDQNINFVCQIKGEKIWDLAPNTHVVNPMVRHTLGTPADRTTAAHAKSELPSKMPKAGRVRVVLKPGSVLYVPRGYWHQTSAKGDSIALNFTYEQVSWAQVVSSAISDTLLKDEKWRSVAYSLRGDGPLRLRAEAELAVLLKKSEGLLKNIKFDDLT